MVDIWLISLAGKNHTFIRKRIHLIFGRHGEMQYLLYQISASVHGISERYFLMKKRWVEVTIPELEVENLLLAFHLNIPHMQLLFLGTIRRRGLMKCVSGGSILRNSLSMTTVSNHAKETHKGF